MRNNFDCAMCASGTIGGELTLSGEARSEDGHWTSFSAQTFRLCPDCYRFCTGILASSASGAGRPGLPGMPMSRGAMRGVKGRCEGCSGQLMRKRFVIDAFPRQERDTHRASPMLVRRNHLCRQCFVWWRMMLQDGGTLRGRGGRRSEGPLGSWMLRGRVDVAIASLEPRDRRVLEDVVRASNGRVLSFSQLFWERDPGKVALFVHAGKRHRATSFVNGLPAWLRGDVVVVTRPDSTGDALAALRAGAGELLVSPLSPQQVIGAMERVRNLTERPQKDPLTGLPRFTPEAAPGRERAAHTVTVKGLGLADLGLGIAHLRRFTRGYDTVGITPDREPCALVECPAADLPAVQRRMGLVFSGLANVQTQAGSGALARAAS